MNRNTSSPNAAAVAGVDGDDPLLRAWNERDQFDPDCWFGIPDFDVKPADVKFRGFYSPILYPGNAQLTHALRGYVRIARTLARKDGITSVRELRHIAAEVLALADSLPDEELNSEEFWLRTMSVKQRAAYSYTWCIEGLERYSAFALGPLRNAEGQGRAPEGLFWQTAYAPVHPTPEEAIGNIAHFGQWITSWSHDGAKSALARRMRALSPPGPRLAARKPLKARVSLLMRRHKVDGLTFKQFLIAWERSGALDGLALELSGAKYEVLDERDPTGQPGEYTFSSLQSMYSESDKKGAFGE